MCEWQPIETAPKNVVVDLWCVDVSSDISFYCATPIKLKAGLAAGRATDWKLGDDGKWRSSHGLGYPLVVKPTHWQPLPEPPQ